jgi:hypothetical protein
VNWKVVLAVGVVVGGVLWAARRKALRQQNDGALWAEATDPVVRFGES